MCRGGAAWPRRRSGGREGGCRRGGGAWGGGAALLRRSEWEGSPVGSRGGRVGLI